MKEFRWSETKNAELRRARGVSFEEIVSAIGAGGLRDVLKHRNAARYPRQSVLVVELRDYAYLMPVQRRDGLLLLENHYPEPQGHERPSAKDGKR